MTEIKRLLELRTKLKRKKPEFIRQDAHKVKRLENKWRRPKGLHSKMRHKFKGYRKLVSKGYKSPLEVRGLSRDGRRIVIVSNVNDILQLEGKNHVAVIAKSVGMRKRLLIVEKANEKQITIVNVDNQKDFKKILEEKMMEKRMVKKATDKEVGKEEKKLKSNSDGRNQDKEEKKEPERDDSLQSLQKKELDRVLTKK